MDGGPGGGAQIALGVFGGIVVFVVLLVALTVYSDEQIADLDPDPMVTPTPTPSPTSTPTPTPTPTPDADSPRPPTDADAAMFAAGFQPADAEDLDSVTVDLTGDGRREIVFVSREAGVVRLDIAVWRGRRFGIAFTDRGGAAEEILDFRVTDLTGDDRREVMTRQAFDDNREAISLWGVEGASEFVRQEADGGCWDGSHTYGAIGAEVDDGELLATCDDAPLPREAWTTDRYEWRDGVWRHVATLD